MNFKQKWRPGFSVGLAFVELLNRYIFRTHSTYCSTHRAFVNALLVFAKCTACAKYTVACGMRNVFGEIHSILV